MIAYTFEKEVGGVSIEVNVDEEGRFTTEAFGVDLEAKTLDHLLYLVRETVDSFNTEVPFVNSDGERGVMRGVHKTERKLLVTWAGGAKGKLNTYSPVFPVDAISEDEIAEIGRLEAEVEERLERLREIRKATVNAEDLWKEKHGADLFDWKREKERMAAEGVEAS